MTIGALGHVTGKIAPGRVGEVMLEIRGGTEAYLAYGLNPDDVIEVGTRVVVLESLAPRSVRVAPL